MCVWCIYVRCVYAGVMCMCMGCVCVCDVVCVVCVLCIWVGGNGCGLCVFVCVWCVYVLGSKLRIYDLEDKDLV